MNIVLAVFAVFSMLLTAGSAIAIDPSDIESATAANPLTPETLASAIVVDDEFVKANLKKMKVYDSRRKGEYLESHIAGAISMPYKEKSSNTVNFDASKDRFNISKYPADKDTPVIVYCNGIRCWSCYKSAVMLIRAGYTNVHWYRNNGFPGWIAKGYPLEE